MRLKAIDLCCGAGGWACAARGLPIDIVLAVDLWDAACRTHQLNHPETQVLRGDLREMDLWDDDLRRKFLELSRGIDLVLGAIPCEWLSYRRRLNQASPEECQNERATLSAVLGLVNALCPAYWCLEDVKGLARELPPNVPWLELNSRHYSAQRRKRIYIGRFPAPILRMSLLRMRDKLRPGPYRIGRRSADRIPVRSQAFHPDRVFAVRPGEKAPTVCNLSSRRDAELVIVESGLAGGRRQMEWQEGAALQGFPEDYVFYGSPSDVWKMIGQAIQIDTGRAILQEIVKHAQTNRSPRVVLHDAVCPVRVRKTGH